MIIHIVGAKTFRVAMLPCYQGFWASALGHCRKVIFPAIARGPASPSFHATYEKKNPFQNSHFPLIDDLPPLVQGVAFLADGKLNRTSPEAPHLWKPGTGSNSILGDKTSTPWPLQCRDGEFVITEAAYFVFFV